MSAVHFIRDGRFVCTAEQDAPCRNYPGCDCEVWTRELHGQVFGEPIGRAPSGHTLYAAETIPPAPGHETAPQDECWIEPWLTNCALEDTYMDEREEEVYGATFPDGPVEYEWQGDYMTWEYADDTRPVEIDA